MGFVKTEDGAYGWNCPCGARDHASCVCAPETQTTPDARWTIAYRKHRANRFLRVDGVALSWDLASELGNEVTELLGDGFEVYVICTAAAEDDNYAYEEDRGNILVASGRRVKVKEGGVLPEGIVPGNYGIAAPASPAPQKRPQRPLGERQEAVLDCMRRFRSYPSGFVYDNHSTTVRILEGLAKRGLVGREIRTDRRTGSKYAHYEIAGE